jgi:hypothetical protein
MQRFRWKIAGFNQLFDETNGAASWRYGVGLDYRLRSNLFVGTEATWREISEPILNFDAQAKRLEHADEQTHHAYVHWLPIAELALNAEFVYDKYSAENGGFLTEGFGVPEKLVTFSVPFGVRYFHRSGFFAGAGATYVHQDVNRAEDFPDGSDDFFVVDAAVGYRLPRRFGIVSLSVANLFDQNKFSGHIHKMEYGHSFWLKLPCTRLYGPNRSSFSGWNLRFVMHTPSVCSKPFLANMSGQSASAV